MPVESPQLPYGMRDVKLIPLDSSGNEGTPVDLPAAQTFSFSEAEEFETLRGDDRDVAIRGRGPKVEWDLEAGGISLEAWQVLTGGTLTSSGVTPNATKALKKKVTDARGYFKAIGQAVNDNDGDTHMTVFKCKCTDSIEGEFADGSFFITSCSGEGIGDKNDDLWEIRWNETETALPGEGGINELVQIVINATGGEFDLMFDGGTAADLDYNISPTALQLALEGLPAIGAGNILVTAVPSGWLLEFTGALAEADQPAVTVDGTDLTGGGVAVLPIRAGVAP